MKEIFHHTATFEFALHAYNLLAIINQHAKVIYKWLNRLFLPVLLINVRMVFTFFDKCGNITKTNHHLLKTFTIGEF